MLQHAICRFSLFYINRVNDVIWCVMTLKVKTAIKSLITINQLWILLRKVSISTFQVQVYIWQVVTVIVNCFILSRISFHHQNVSSCSEGLKIQECVWDRLEERSVPQCEGLKVFLGFHFLFGQPQISGCHHRVSWWWCLHCHKTFTPGSMLLSRNV